MSNVKMGDWRQWSVFFFVCWLSVTAGAQGVKFDYLFQEAERQKLARNYAEAIELFDYCRRLEPTSGVVLYELADLYRYVGNDSLSIGMLEEACRLFPDNDWYKNRLVSLYVEHHRNEEALKHVEDMAQRWPEKGEVLMMLLDLYGQKQDYEQMVKVLDKIEVKEGKSEMLSMEKFRLFLQMKDEERAFEEMERLAEEYPNDLRYQVVIGDLYRDAGRKEEALEQFKAVEAKDSVNGALLLSMANYYKGEGEDSLYHIYMRRLLTSKDVDDATRVRMMGVMVHENLAAGSDSVAIMRLFDEVLSQSPEQAGLLELKVRYMVTKKMPRTLIKPDLWRMLEMDPENNMARQELLSYAIEENDTVGVVNVCKPAVDYKTEDPVFYYYLGVAYFQQDQLEQAVEAFSGGLEHVEQEGGSNRLKLYTNMYALMGDIYHKLGQDEKAFQAYDSCLVYTKDDAMVLNNYAYYLSLKKKNLGRAEEMVRRANELEPNNGTYMDTYAWVLYQLKRYEEAGVWMDKAVEQMDKDGEEMSDDVLEHIQKINKKNRKKQ
ncbi:MAG: tetratricopeptide repeat protein [Bacteroidaceae bacterium]|nr:tetratricopeptide repeat protein [Bacteroidaceae bacterium]